jgi:hypothetical protein
MRDRNGRLPALLLVATLLTASPLGLAGGRDVPDHIAEGSSESYTPPAQWDCADDAVTSVSAGWISIDIVTAPDGTISMQPSLLRAAGDLLLRVFAPRNDAGGTCSAD